MTAARRGITVLTICSAMAGVVPMARSQSQTPVFRATAEGVTVTVSVRKDGRPVTGLRAADFELLDDGVVQQVETVSVERLPIDVTLLLDVSGSVQGTRLARLKSAVGETATLLAPSDRLRLLALQQDVREVFGFQPGGVPPSLDRLVAGGGTALFDGLAAALMRVPDPDRRQLIIACTDGIDTISVLDINTTRRVADAADAVLHMVMPVAGPGRGGPSTLPVVADLAARTGGQVFEVDVNGPLSPGFIRAIDEFRTSYVLRYEPTRSSSRPAARGWHELTVRVRGGAYDVRARKGYGER